MSFEMERQGEAAPKAHTRRRGHIGTLELPLNISEVMTFRH